jgi:hypothetical protein
MIRKIGRRKSEIIVPSETKKSAKSTEKIIYPGAEKENEAGADVRKNYIKDN